MTLQTPMLIFALPFVADLLINLGSLTGASQTEQIEEGSEYIKITDSEERNFINPSERLLSRSLRENNLSESLLT